MPHLTANGHTSHTQYEPEAITEAICRYLAGESSNEAAAAAGMPAATLRHTLRRHDLIRTKTEATIQEWVDEGKASPVARRRLIKRDYTKYQANHRVEELAERFGVCRKSIRRDLRAIGYDISRSEQSIIREWGSFRKWREAQRQAALLVRKREWTKTRAHEHMDITFRTLQRLLSAWDERREDGAEKSLEARSTYVSA